MKQTATYTKKRDTTAVGDNVLIPGDAIGIAVSDLSPFGDMVQVSWLEPVEETNKLTNDFTVYSTRTDYADESPVDVPDWAVAPTLWEPPESIESVVYYLG